MKELIILLVSPIILSACASPQIYIIDRQTVMEADASGDWPEVESQLLKTAQKAGPTFFANSLNKDKQKKLQNILNGELKGK